MFQWVRLLPMSEVVWWRGSCSISLSSCPGGVVCLCWWLGGNCYHRRCLAACRRRVGGLWSQNPPWLLGWASVAGPLGGGVDGVPGLPLVGLTCAVKGLVLPPDTPSDHLRCPGRQVRSGRPTGAELPPLPPLPASPEHRVGQDVSGNTRGPLACAPKADRGRKGPVSGLGRRGWASDAA